MAFPDSAVPADLQDDGEGVLSPPSSDALPLLEPIWQPRVQFIEDTSKSTEQVGRGGGCIESCRRDYLAQAIPRLQKHPLPSQDADAVQFMLQDSAYRIVLLLFN